MGFGFTANKTYTIRFAVVALKTGTTDTAGSLNASFAVPLGYPRGEYAISVITDAPDTSYCCTIKTPVGVNGDCAIQATDGTHSANAVFVATFQANITPTTSNTTPGYVGMNLTIEGAGFKPDIEVTINQASTNNTEPLALAKARTDASGNFTATFAFPAARSGDYTLIATDGTNVRQFPFIMESEAPHGPMPLLPEPKTKAKQPAYFDWTNSDDPSGVTYVLHVASDKDFRSIVLEKKGLTKSEYTMLDSERLKSVSKENPYYWRVKAIDGTSPESPWSDPIAFHVGFVFTFSDDSFVTLPAWSLYIMLGVGVLLLGFVAFWIGRRSSRGY